MGTLIATSFGVKCFIALFSDFEIRMDSDRKKVLPVTATDVHADSSVQRLSFLTAYFFSSRLVLFVCTPCSYFGSLFFRKKDVNNRGYFYSLK